MLLFLPRTLLRLFILGVYLAPFPGAAQLLRTGLPLAADRVAPLTRAQHQASRLTDHPALRPAGPGDANWQAGFQHLGVDGEVKAFARAPNGDLLVAGRFLVAGSVVARSIARWNGSTWQGLGEGVSEGAGSAGLGTINAVAVAPNGDVVIGGQFALTVGGPGVNVARWNGTTWTALGGGVPGVVNAIVIQTNGDVIVGGEFTSAGANAQCVGLARWDGVAWRPYGSGAGGRVFALALAPTGQLLVAGSFANAGGNPDADGVALWTGAAWQAMETGVFTSGNSRLVRAAVALPNGDFVIGGQFNTAGNTTVSNVARWHSGTWSALGAGVDSRVNALVVLPNGDLVAGGHFTMAGSTPTPSNIARWDGTSWQAVGTHRGNQAAQVNALTTTGTGDVVAGWTGNSSTSPLHLLGTWDGTNWRPYGTGLNGPVWAVLVAPNGDLIVGGEFTDAGGNLDADYIARWNGSTWQPLGPGLNDAVFALAFAPNGDLIAGGKFMAAGGQAFANSIARWDGTTWQAMGTTPPADGVYAIALSPAGEVYVGGYSVGFAGFNATVARWDGVNWQELTGLQGMNAYVQALQFMPNGDLVAGGLFSLSLPGRVALARWDGTTWQPVGGGLASPTIPARVMCLALAPTGDLLVGGRFDDAGANPDADNIARWDGTAWQAFGAGLTSPFPNELVASIALTPTGELVAGGSFFDAGANPDADNIARWDGTTWQPYGTGLNDAVLTVKVTPAGDVVAGGNFTATGDGSKVSAYVGIYRAVLGTNEPATAASYQLYPNPATEEVSISGAPASAAVMYDGLGRLIRTIPLTAGAATFDVGDLTPGVYVVRAGATARRLVVQ